MSRHHAKVPARALCLFPVILGALGVFGCGGDRPGGPPRQGSSKDTAAAVTFPLNEENRSGRHGEATLQPGEKIPPGLGGASGEGMRVSIRITPDTGESNPAHIHNVTCAKYRAMSSFGAGLATVEDGLNARLIMGGPRPSSRSSYPRVRTVATRSTFKNPRTRTTSSRAVTFPVTELANPGGPHRNLSQTFPVRGRLSAWQ